MSTTTRPRLSPEDYLALERRSEAKHEYRDGEMIPMVGASRRHNLIVANIISELREQLKGRPCEVYPPDMRVKVDSIGLYTYPDVAVVCGEPRFEDAEVDTLLNPTLLVEVLSESTAEYDRGTKFAHYRKLDSLREYVIVSQRECLVEHYVRRPDGQWLFSEVGQFETSIDLPSIDCNLPLGEIYDKVDWGDSTVS